MQRRHLIFQRKCGAGTLQQSLGNEKTEAKAESAVVLIAARLAQPGPPMGDIGRPDAIQYFRSKTRPVVTDGDAHLGGRPLRQDLHALVGKIDRVLDQIAEAVADSRIARTGRLVRPIGRELDLDSNAEMTMRRDRLLDESR